MSERNPDSGPRDGAFLSMGTHGVGRFAETCSMCGELASHRFAEATFNPGEWFYCDRHFVLACFQDAYESAPDELAPDLEALAATPAFAELIAEGARARG